MSSILTRISLQNQFPYEKLNIPTILISRKKSLVQFLQQSIPTRIIQSLKQQPFLKVIFFQLSQNKINPKQTQCFICENQFGFNNKRHHCRFCGLTVCSLCLIKRRLVSGSKNIFLPVCCECEQKCLQIQVNKDYIKNKLINDNIKKKLMIEKQIIEQEIKFYSMHIEKMEKQRNEVKDLKEREQQKDQIQAEVQKEQAIIQDIQEKIQNSKLLKIQLDNSINYTKKLIKYLKKKIQKQKTKQNSIKMDQLATEIPDNQLNNKIKDHYHLNPSIISDQSSVLNLENIDKINQQEKINVQKQQNNYCKNCKLI